MTVELALVISIVSVGFGLLSGILNLRRNQKADDKSEATQLTMVIVKLEGISMGVSEIKNKMSSIESETKENRERIIKVEESAKQANLKIDNFLATRHHNE